MIELFGWNVGVGFGGGLIAIVGALLLAAIGQYIGKTAIGYEWIFAAVAALVGAWLGSEAFGTLSTWGPLVDGLYVVPALLGAIVVGGVVDGAVRWVTGGTYLEPRPI